jgi:hypothetical protein
MIVCGGDEGLDRDQSVGARAVLDHDRLAPARRQPVSEQPRADVDAGAGSERHDEFHRPLRPGCWLRARACDNKGRGQRGQREREYAPSRNLHHYSSTRGLVLRGR